MTSAVAAQVTTPTSAARDVEHGRISVAKFVAIATQLGLLALALRQFQIENAAFLRVALLAFAGFTIHALLPLRLRLPSFLLLSIAATVVALGVQNTVWLLGIGITLIAVCHLPVPFRTRGALLLLFGGILAAQRAGLLPVPWPVAIWPILGSMFMFRLIVYFYDLRHDTVPPSATQALSYFFMLPNACFALFPVIDFRTFRRNYFDSDAYQIYATGIEWMLRGVLHLVLYRFVYYYLTMAPTEVDSAGDLLRYLLSNFLLYLRVSGQFHVVVGMLCMFGFRLPETNHRYLLASSFTDFWRRINIYWKDFMLKVFYYPAYFKLRRFGDTEALVLSTIFVFVMTWFLHAYQWFWLRGSTLLVWQDVLFWTVLGALVVVNALHEARHGRQRSLAKAAWSWWRASTIALKTAGTFSVICVLWSFWTAESIETWLSMWRAAAASLLGASGGTVLPVAAVMVVGVVAKRGMGANDGKGPSGSRHGWTRHATVVTLSLVLLVATGVERIHTRFGPTVATVIHSLRSGRLSRVDNAKLERGYYENLLAVDRFNSQLWEVYMKKPANWLDIDFANLKRFTGDFAAEELIPSFVSESRYGSISTNRWGMRDRHYEREPPPGTYRIAILGPSTVMGWGVGDEETFEALLEYRLNRECRGGTYTAFEILNLGVPGYEPPQQLAATQRALGFSPKSIFYVAVPRELGRATHYMARVVRKGLPIPYPELDDIVRSAGVGAATDETTAIRRLQPFSKAIVAAVYGRIARAARERGTAPVWIFLPHASEGLEDEELAESRRIAESAGFAVVDLSGLYTGVEISTVWLAEWDKHPNARAHQMIADRLYDELRRNPRVLHASDQSTRAEPRFCPEWETEH